MVKKMLSPNKQVAAFTVSLIANAGLTCGLFTKDSMEIPCPDIAAGLYIRTRDNQVVKVSNDLELRDLITKSVELMLMAYLIGNIRLSMPET